MKILKSAKGIYRNGHIELEESPAGVLSETSVCVLFLGTSDIELSEHGIGEDSAEKLRASLASFGDWDDPAMDVYDDYDAAHSKL